MNCMNFPRLGNEDCKKVEGMGDSYDLIVKCYSSGKCVIIRQLWWLSNFICMHCVTYVNCKMKIILT